MELRFFYDVACPYAYLASLRVEAVAERTGATLVWCPVLLGGLYRHHGTDQVPASGWSAEKVAIGAADLEREARLQSAPFGVNPLHPQRTVNAMRLVLAAADEQKIPLSKALFAAYWAEGADLNDPATLGRIATAHGVDPDSMQNDSIKQELHYLTAEAADEGIFGVPAFQVERRIWWGQDRLHLVEQALGGDPAIEPPVDPHPGSGSAVAFYHDFSSPFSYLGSTQIERIAEQRGTRVEWKPILLGALFRSIGTPDVPLFSMCESKMRYMQRDLVDWAKWWGVDFEFAPHFPLRTVLPLRVSIIEPRSIHPLYRAAWSDGLDIGDPEVLTGILDDTGLDGASLIEGAQDPGVKQALRDNTEAAVATGVCGVPTAVTKGEIFWGQDRLHRVAAALMD